MSSPYRTSARKPSYLSRITESWTDTVLAPDIITERDHGAVKQGPVPAMPVAPEPTPAQARSRTDSRPASAPRVETSIIEVRHPEIARAISLLWGFPEMNQYFDRLWLADGSQGPIDPDAMSELMLLARIHQSIVPQGPGRSLASLYGGNRMHDTNGRPRNPWSDVPPRR